MPSERKVQIVKKLKEKLARAKGLVLTDYHGLSVPEVEALRDQLRESQADLQVVKNTLLQLALQKSKFQNPNVKLEGPTAVILSQEEEIKPLKALYDFAEEHEALQVKGGFFEGLWTAAEKLQKIASLPSREVLLAKLTGTMQAPVLRLLTVSEANIRGLVGVLANISESKANQS
jgi:large subunit ribosomal protein L10